MAEILTNQSRSNAIYLQDKLDTSKDIVITFDYACYGIPASGSEGFNLFFINANNDALSGGGPGSALNYAYFTGTSASSAVFYYGIAGGALGIGFDITGNYATSADHINGYADAVPNTICLRADYLSSYNTFYRTENLAGTAYGAPVTLYQSTTAEPDFYRVRVRLADFSTRVLVDIKPAADIGGWNASHNYIETNIPYNFPVSVKPCLSFSRNVTGTNFVVQNFNIDAFKTDATSAGPYDPDAQAFVNASGATDIEPINEFVVGLKTLGLWDSFLCWPMATSLNAGSGYTVYSLGGLTTSNGIMSSWYDYQVPADSRVYYIDIANLSSYKPSEPWRVNNLKNLPYYANVWDTTGYVYTTAYGGALHVLSGNIFNYNPILYGVPNGTGAPAGADTWKELGLDNHFTLNFWIQLSAYPDAYGDSFQTGDEYLLSGFRLWMYGRGQGDPSKVGKLVFNTNQSGGNLELSTPNPLPLNEPVNFTVTVTPSANYSNANPYVTVCMYLNGELVSSGVGTFYAADDIGIILFYIGSSHAKECEFFLNEVFNQPLTQWEVAKNYNKYASRFNKPEVYIPYPEWTDQGLLFTSGTWVDLINYNNNTYPMSAGQYGLASFGIVNLSGHWASNPGGPGNEGNMLKVVGGRVPGSYASPTLGYSGNEPGLNVNTPFGAGTLGLNNYHSDFNGKYPGDYIRTYTDLTVFCPGGLRSYYDNNPFFCFYTPASSLSACKYYINNTITQTIYPIGSVQPQDTYGYPMASDQTLVAGIIKQPTEINYTNSNNTIFMSGLLSLTAVSDFQVNRLYELTKRTIGSSLGLP
jgi:hypothetical protein